MSWDIFNVLGPVAVLCWLAALFALFILKKPRLADLAMIAGIAILTIFIVGLWISLDRPPMRTMGETRLWYSFFLSVLGFLTYKHWKYPWLLAFSVIIASVFVFINVLKPEIHSISLMPALQSRYFIPHVTVYILSYAMLGVAAIAAALQFVRIKQGEADPKLTSFIDTITHVGLGFLLLGLLTGAAWAKEAWGHYWSWDPKETWAFITAAAYLVYIHLRLKDVRPKLTLSIPLIGFVLLMITWIGVNYLPAAQSSVHIYS